MDRRFIQSYITYVGLQRSDQTVYLCRMHASIVIDIILKIRENKSE